MVEQSTISLNMTLLVSTWNMVEQNTIGVNMVEQNTISVNMVEQNTISVNMEHGGTEHY
jgi:hypothetical protein